MFNTEAKSVSQIKANDFIMFAFNRETKEQTIWQIKDIQPIEQSWEDIHFKKQKRVQIIFHNDIKIVENIRSKKFVVTDEIEWA